MISFYNKHLKQYLENELFVGCSLFLFAFSLRLSFLPHLIDDPAFIQPILDSKEHNWLAHELINLNGWRMTKFWFHTPGYAYFMALVYKFLGFSVVRLAVVQYILGSLAACLVFFMVKRLINRGAALFAALLMSVYWMLIYTQSHVFSENLSMLLNLLTVNFLLFSRDSWRKYLCCGVLLGLSAAVRPEILLFAGVLWVWLLIRKLPVITVIRYYGLFVIGVCLCLLPLLIRNHQLSGNVKVQQLIGVNFYVGSMPEFKGSGIYLMFDSWQSLLEKFYLEREQADLTREPTEKELNSFYASKVIEYIRKHPLQWAGFMAGKIGSVLIGTDYPRSEDVYFYDKYIRAGPYELIQTWFICILAMIGIGLSLRQEPLKFTLPLLFLASYLPVLFFDYRSRFLISHMPLLIIFSSYALSVLIDHIQKKRLRDVASILSVALALFTCVAWNPMDIAWPSKAEAYHNIGSNFLYSEDPEEAKQYFRKTLGADPMYFIAINDLGVAYMTSGNFSLAAQTFQRAIDILPHPLFTANYQMALRLLEEGRAYDQWEGFPEEEKKSAELYYDLFPYPYEGAIYQ